MDEQLYSEVIKGSPLDRVVSSDNISATRHVAHLKSVLTELLKDSPDFPSPYLSDFIQDESAALIQLYHGANLDCVRMVIDFKGDVLIAEIPLDLDDNDYDHYTDLLWEGIVRIYYQGDVTKLTLTDEVMKKLNNPREDDEFYFPSGSVNKASSVITENSAHAGHYARQKIQEMLAADPRFKVDALLVSKDVCGALLAIEDNELPMDDYKKQLAFTIASNIKDGSENAQHIEIGPSDLKKINATGLLDSLTMKEFDYLLSDGLSNEYPWSNSGLEGNIKLLMTGSSPERNKQLLTMIELLSHEPIPDDLLAFANAEIANGYIQEIEPVKNKKLPRL